MNITGGDLHFVYRFPLHESLSFTVGDIDEVYLNLLILPALFGAARFALGIRVIKPLLFALAVIFVIHVSVLTAYAVTHIWTFTLAQDPEFQRQLVRHVAGEFPRGAAVWLKKLLYHWNAWGWDVIPVMIWAAALLMFDKSNDFYNLLRSLVHGNS